MYVCVYIYIYMCIYELYVCVCVCVYIYIYIYEKEVATHSSILAWKIPWTEKPGRLQYMGSQRLGHD